MSDAVSSQYAPEVTAFSENELQRLLAVASPPISLLGGWAVHLHVTEAFRSEYGREYIGSRDIDLGVYVDPAWDAEDLRSEPVATTLSRIESEMEYNRGRFGFYQYFHRTTRKALTDEEATDYPQHQIFRVDVDVLPSTRELDAFADAFGFRPPADPLLAPVFADDWFEELDDFVPWNAPAGVRLVPRPVLAAMKVRAFPERDKSHKRVKDLADLHALVWYGREFHELRPAVTDRLRDGDVARFSAATTDETFARAAALIDVDQAVVRNSIEQLLV